MTFVPTALDHLVIGVPDLTDGIARLERLCGVSAAPGGTHPGRGTQNALLSLGDGAYLEVIGPDPLQPDHHLNRPRSFGVHAEMAPRLVGWAIASTDIDALISRARDAGYDPGEVQSRQRLAADGAVVAWRLSSRPVTPENFLLPFVIDWGATPHPSQSTPTGLQLVHLRAEHPDPEHVLEQLSALGLQLEVVRGAQPALIATLDTPKGRIDLR
jgi:hypothetical protein